MMATPQHFSLVDIIDPGFRLEIDGTVFRLADMLALAADAARNLPTSRRIRVPAHNPLDVLVHLEAVWSIGAIPVPSSEITTPEAVTDTPSELAGDDDTIALILPTSGSTSRPRHPAFRFESLLLSAQRIATYLGLNRDDAVAMQLPCDHGFGLIGQLFAAAFVGATLVPCGGAFPEERAARLLSRPFTVVAGVPHMLRSIRDTFAAAPSELRDTIRIVGSAGGPLHPVLLTELVRTFDHAVVWNQYGCTEAGPRLTAMPSFHPAFFAGTIGRAIPGVRLWIDGPLGQPGNICFATETAMAGYWGDPEATEKMRVSGGWRTGDIGVIDELDRLHVLGRSDDVIKIRGEKVSLQHISQCAETAGATAAHTVFVPDRMQPMEGRIILVYESPAPMDRLALAAAMPRHGMPKRMLWWPALPRLANGKLNRAAIDAVILEEESP